MSGTDCSCCSVAESCPTLCDPVDCSTPGSSVLHCLLEFAKIMSIELVILSYHLTLCFPFLLLPSIFPSIRVFSNKSAPHIRWPKYWSFSFSISPSSKYSGLIPFRIDWLELLAVQGTLKSLLQHHNSKASILQCSVKTSSLGYNHKIQQKNVLQKGENSPNLTNADKHQERRIW